MTVKNVLARIASLFAVCGTAMHSGGACAQSSEGGGERLEEIVVTAQKTPETVQSIPKTVEVASQAQLQAAGVSQLQQLNTVIPSISGVPPSNGVPNQGAPPAIRGISSFAFSIGVQAQTGIVVDDVPLPTFSLLANDLSDVTRIEVLAGPQSTLSGRNAAGGLINIVTADPSSTLTGNASVEQTSDEQTRVTAFVSGPLSEQLDASVSGYWNNWAGNMVDEALGGLRFGTDGFDDKGVRAKLLWRPDADWTVRFSAYYSESSIQAPPDETTGPYVLLSPNAQLVLTGQALSTLGTPVRSYNNSVNTPYFTTEQIENVGTTVRIDRELPFGTLSSITSYSHSQEPTHEALLGIQIPSFGITDVYATTNIVNKYTTQEFRLTSAATPEERLKYILGLFYDDDDNSEPYSRQVFPVDWNRTASIQNVALYGRATYKLPTDTSITGGVRFQHDSYDYTFDFVPPVSVDPNSRGSSSYNFVTGETSLQQAFTQDVLGYLTFSHGETGRAYDLEDNTDAALGKLTPLASEKVDDYEVGLKTQWLDHRLTLNIDGFLAKYTNFQTQALAPPTNVDELPVIRLLAIGSVETKGVEFGAQADPNDRLRLALNLAYIDAKITNYPNATCYTFQTAAAGCVNGVQSNLKGLAMPGTPDLSVNYSGSYTEPLGSLPFDLKLGVFGRYQSSEHFDVFGSPYTYQGGFGIWNLSAALLGRDTRYNVEAFVNNVFNKHYYATLGADALSSAPAIIPGYARDSFRYGGLRVKVAF